ncbi:MAG: hypothetical protein JNK85_21025 [Verrucomicrobiales bacterium]|nr:hypothetical protein [Verrucomicrobiales bacterium]
MLKASWMRVIEVFCAVFALPSSSAEAATFAWRNPPVSGAYNSPANWQNADGGGGFPGLGDFAIFRFGTYTVTCNGASSGQAELIGIITLQLDGDFTAGTYIQGGNPVVLRGGGTLRGGPFTVAEEGSLLVDGSGLTMSDFTFGILTAQTRLTGINGARITSSSQVGCVPQPRLEGASEWHHTGALNVGKCIINSGSLLAADTLTVVPAELDGGRLQAGRLNGGGHAINGSTITADAASLNDWLLEGGGTSMRVSGSTSEGLLYADVRVKSGATLAAGALADSAWYTVDGSGSSLAVAGGIAGVGPQKVTILNQGSGSAATLTQTQLIVRDPGSLFTLAARAEDMVMDIRDGGQVKGGSLRGPMSPNRVAGCSVAGSGAALVLSGNLELGSFGEGSLTIDNGGRVECAAAFLNGGQAGAATSSSVFGANSFWLARQGLVVGDDTGRATLNLGEGGRVEVRGPALAVGLQPGGEGTMVVDGGSSPSPSALDARQVDEMGVGVAGKAQVRVLNHGRVLASKLTVGVESGSQGTLEVVGADTSLEVSNTLEIGRAGLGQLTIHDSSATSADVLVGSNTRSNLLRLTGNSSTLTVAKSLHVGETGVGRLSIERGARVLMPGVFVPDAAVGEASVAHQPGSVGTVTVDGAGSAWGGQRGALIVGTLGHGTLNVTDGGTVDFEQIVIGGGPGGAGVANVSGQGSVIQAVDRMLVGGTGLATGPGNLTVSDGGLLLLRSALTVYKPGVLRLSGGGTIVGQTTELPIPGTVIVANLGTFRLGGRLIGSVQLRPGGRFLPGSSPGRATIEGDLTFTAGSSLEIELAGSPTASIHDQIEATGLVTLAGRAELVFRDGFAPTNGQMFEVVRGGAVAGTFSEVSVRGLAEGFTYSLTNTDGRSLRLTATSTGVSTTQPQLSMERSTGRRVIVHWPDYVTGWKLEQTIGLGTPSWISVVAPGNTLSVPITGTTEFFRLVPN